MVQHKNLIDPDIHEPKGASSASANQVMTANGDGTTSFKSLESGSLGVSGSLNTQVLVSNGTDIVSWQYPLVHAGCFWNGGGASTTITGSGAADVRLTDIFTTQASETLGTHPEITVNTDGSITYTGLASRHFHLVSSVTVDTASGASQEVKVVFYHYKNSTSSWVEEPSSELRMHGDSSFKASTAIHGDFLMSTNDKVTVAFQNVTSAANVRLYHFYLFGMGMVGM